MNKYDAFLLDYFKNRFAGIGLLNSSKPLKEL